MRLIRDNQIIDDIIFIHEDNKDFEITLCDQILSCCGNYLFNENKIDNLIDIAQIIKELLKYNNISEKKFNELMIKRFNELGGYEKRYVIKEM